MVDDVDADAVTVAEGVVDGVVAAAAAAGGRSRGTRRSRWPP